MTTITVGTDLVAIDRLKTALNTGGSRLAARLFTDREVEYCRSRSDEFGSLAARFAAKEAVRKIFGQWGFEDVVWRETEIVNAQNGAPAVILHGTAKERAGAHRFALSLTHTEDYAQAFCVAYKDESDE